MEKLPSYPSYLSYLSYPSILVHPVSQPTCWNINATSAAQAGRRGVWSGNGEGGLPALGTGHAAIGVK